jgi:uncharacterized protein
MRKAVVAMLCIAGIMLPHAASAQGPSFNCIAASSPDEVLICQNSQLSALDRRMSGMYFRLRNNLFDARRGELEASQARWMRERVGCGRDFGCVLDAYQKRIAELADY